MRELPFDRKFDGAYCMLTSFGYFDEDANLKVAEGVARALKPGGRFLLDIVNRDYVVSDLPTRIWWEGVGCVVLEEVDFNFHTSRIVTRRSVVFEDGRSWSRRSRSGPTASTSWVDCCVRPGSGCSTSRAAWRPAGGSWAATPAISWSSPRSGPTRSRRRLGKPRAITSACAGRDAGYLRPAVNRSKGTENPIVLGRVETHVFCRGVRPICVQGIARPGGQRHRGSDRSDCSIWNIYLTRNVYQKRVQQHWSGPEKRNDESKYGKGSVVAQAAT